MMDGMGLCMWSCLCCVSSRPRKTAPGAGLRCRIRTRKRCWLLPAQSPGPASLLLALSMVVVLQGKGLLAEQEWDSLRGTWLLPSVVWHLSSLQETRESCYLILLRTEPRVFCQENALPVHPLGFKYCSTNSTQLTIFTQLKTS